jgi:5-methylcytosine-specific restriction enzyme subunit McrC
MDIPIRNIYFLLSYAWNKLEEAEKMEINIDDYEDSLNLLARVLVTGSNHLLKKGLDKVYITVTEEYPGVKGKINFKESLNKQLFKQGKAICTFDVFSSNVLHNQILKSILKRLTKFTELDLKLKKEVWDCYYCFHEVEELEVQFHDFKKVRIHRNNFSYDFLLRVSRLIMENSVLNENDGSYQFRDFTRNEKAMSHLFEEFVRNFYSKKQNRYKVRREDIKWRAEALFGGDLSLLPKMQTDITLEANNHKLIIDTKYYKNTLSVQYNTEKFHSNNLYQIYSYLLNLEKDDRNPNNVTCDGMLLYPTVQREIDNSFQMGTHKIRVATVDLSQEWPLIIDRLLNLIPS